MALGQSDLAGVGGAWGSNSSLVGSGATGRLGQVR